MPATRLACGVSTTKLKWLPLGQEAWTCQPVLRQVFAQGLEEALAVRVVLEDGFAVVAAIHDVVDHRILDSEFSDHKSSLRDVPKGIDKTC